MTTRRSFLQGIFAASAAPAIVKVANLMPVKSSIIAIPTDEETLATYLWKNHPERTLSVYGQPSQSVREYYSRELAQNIADRIDRIVFETLTKGML